MCDSILKKLYSIFIDAYRSAFIFFMLIVTSMQLWKFHLRNNNQKFWQSYKDFLLNNFLMKSLPLMDYIMGINKYMFWLLFIFVYQKSFKRMFKTSFLVQNPPLDLCARAVNSQRSFVAFGYTKFVKPLLTFRAVSHEIDTMLWWHWVLSQLHLEERLRFISKKY